MKNDKTELTKTDIAHTLLKGGLGAIPVLGAMATELFDILVTPPLEKRRNEWKNDISKRLELLEEQGRIDFQKLANSDEFVDAILQASTFALRTSETIKIESLKNAIINTALSETIDSTKTQIFIKQIDNFTPLHLQVLNLIKDPDAYFNKKNRIPPNSISTILDLIKTAFPELTKEDDALIKVIWNDLESIGFHRTNNISTSMTTRGALSPRTTPLAKDFISFITNFYSISP